MIAENTLTEEKTKFKFGELCEDSKQRAINNELENCWQDDWHQYLYDDAKSVGLKITGFDLDRNRHAEGEFTESEFDVANAILKNHGDECETFKTAVRFAAHVALMSKTDKFDDAGEKTESFAELCEQFLKDTLNNYARLLQDEADYRGSDEAITETILANDFDFDADGNRI